ncbi:ATP-binding cassette domain-containing protein [Leucobacter sp. wl10]|uniref:ABC transporter ATP-binding protein/permease n=1 Tax=Leucobacter sp. wl10 TaxID=2304677 RepID=UPI000E5A97B1|nr:ABC transporter ATP-binding protein/permease [Leucobacter sp. wl10]RGE18037.1 ATP-binding cassette domain-containing protein [Leucobacter sp. wl10]
MSNERIEILRMEGVGRTYGGASEAPALSEVSLSILQGEFVAVIGASGAGKSTLLNLFGLLDTASTGKYLVAGHDIAELSDRERDRLRASTFGFVFQESHMLLKETAGGNAALGLSINEVDPELRPPIVSEALETVHLLEKAGDLAGNLSGGERQRVAIARAIATSPRILLADEPTGALDTVNSKRVVRTLRQLNDEGVTVIMITHDPVVAQAADRIIEISDGKIMSDSSEPTVHRSAEGLHREPAALPARTQSTWSRVRERIGSAISNHTVHAARAALLLLAFTVGSGGLVTAIGLSQSAAAQVVGRLDSAALDEFLVVPKNAPSAVRSEFALPETASASEVAEVATARVGALDGVRSVGLTAIAEFDEKITLLNPTTVHEQPAVSPDIRVVDSTYLRLQGVRTDREVSVQRLFAADAQIPAVVLGPALAEKLGYDQEVPGAQLWIGSTPAAIVGIIDDLGEEPRLDSALVVNPALAATVSAADPSLIVQTAPGEPARLAESIGIAIAPGDASLFKAETVADLRSLTQGVAGDLVSLINIVSWVLLVLSSLSAATAAYLSVHARAAEIALRRAVGESRRSIWGQFVLEGLIVGLLGGVLGSALGVTMLVLFATMQGWTPTFNLMFLALGVATGAATGLLASLYPAAVAARQDPALAVRGT